MQFLNRICKVSVGWLPNPLKCLRIILVVYPPFQRAVVVPPEAPYRGCVQYLVAKYHAF